MCVFYAHVHIYRLRERERIKYILPVTSYEGEGAGMPPHSLQDRAMIRGRGGRESVWGYETRLIKTETNIGV